MAVTHFEHTYSQRLVERFFELNAYVCRPIGERKSPALELNFPIQGLSIRTAFEYINVEKSVSITRVINAYFKTVSGVLNVYVTKIDPNVFVLHTIFLVIPLPKKKKKN